MNWTDVEAAIPHLVAEPGRRKCVQRVMLDLGRECPGILVRVAPQYGQHPYSVQLGQQRMGELARAAARNWTLWVEDDVRLVEGFGERCAAVLEMHGSEHPVISFFSPGDRDVFRYHRGIRLYETAGPNFTYLQCVLMRSDIARGWGELLETWWDTADNEVSRNAADHALGRYCFDRGIRIAVSLPNLAQHYPTPSCYGHGACPRSETFGME
jgi:hypothetical protein